MKTYKNIHYYIRIATAEVINVPPPLINHTHTHTSLDSMENVWQTRRN